MSARYLQLDVATLERDLSDILASFPELAEDESLRADVLEGESSLHEVLSRLVNLAQDSGCMADAIKSRIDGMAKRKAAAEKREEAFRALILRLLQKADLRKVSLPEATLSIAAVPPSVVIVDETAIPDNCYRVKKEINKPVIKALFANGETVPGCAMSNGSERLAVRVA